MTTFNVGDSVYLSAASAVFDGITGKTTPRERTGPFTVEKVYQCGEHWRLNALRGFESVDAATRQFELA